MYYVRREGYGVTTLIKHANGRLLQFSPNYEHEYRWVDVDWRDQNVDDCEQYATLEELFTADILESEKAARLLQVEI